MKNIMKCVEANKQINLLIDDQLTFTESKNLEGHFEICAACKYSYERLLLVRNGLRNQPEAVPSQALDTRILNAFATHHQSKTKPTFWQILTLPKLSFAQTLPILLIGIALAFLLGKFAFAEKIEIVKTVETPIVETKIVEKEVEKIVPHIITVTKAIKIPVIKTKIIRNQTPEGSLKKDSKQDFTERETENFAANDSSFFNQIIQTNLTSDNFRPVSNIEIKVTKKGETHE